MPQLSDLINKPKFVKKEFRPWNLSGTGTIDNQASLNEPVKSDIINETEKSILLIEKEVSLNELPKNEQLITCDQKITGNVTGNKTGNNEVTTKKQRDNNQITQKKQRGNNEVTIRQQPDNITGNITGNTKDFLYILDSIKKLCGIQKQIFLYVLNICSARGALDTGNILSSDLANAANCSIGSAKTSLIRLIEKNLVIRLVGKACRGGHMTLSITKEIQAAAIQAQQAFFNPLTQKTGNVTGNKTDNTILYSSSNIYKNNTTTALPEDWKKINYMPLDHIGFSETQLRQLCDSNTTTPEIVQDAINRFAYSLEYSDKVKSYNDPLNVLMGVLRKGQRWNEPNYISPKELALRQILEEKRTQKENYDLMIKELVDLEFPAWRKQLTKDQIEQIVPKEILQLNLAPAITAALRTHYIDNIVLPRLRA